jgi:uncharacterized protein YqhQ
MADKFHYGGQAVMEGVMMRGEKTIATAVRRPNGEVTVQSKPLSSLYTGWVRKAPFIRGIIVLLESMVLGIGGLVYSANVALEEEEEKISGGSVWLMLLFSLVFAVGLFFLAPLFLTKALDPYISSSLVFHLIEGGLRLVIFFGYLWLISFMPDIKRTFAYHGAEHKTLNAYENGEPLEPRAIGKYGTAHARCGTAFLMTVLVIAILVFTLIGRQELWLMVLSRILLLPVIASLGYEIPQFGARHLNNGLVRLMMAPGLWLQKMTTREPDDRQVEVAIAALKSVLASDGEKIQASFSPDSL